MIQSLIKVVHNVQDALGLPVNYTHHEFTEFKRRLDWSAVDRDRIARLANVLDTTEDAIQGYVEEARQIECQEKEDDAAEAWSGIGNPMGRTDRLTLYCAVRAATPQLAVETGTAAGASALYILTAMERNGHGRLISIDAAQDRRNVGRLIPSHLRDRVELVAGNSLNVLPKLDLAGIDFFLHDSLHRYRYMLAEYRFALHNFAERGVLCSHDVLATNAWKHVAAWTGVQRMAVVKNFGVLRFQRGG